MGVRRIPAKIEDMSREHFKTLEKRLKPGEASASGFLGNGEFLDSIVHADRATLQKLGITHKQIADKLHGLFVKAFTAWKRELEKTGNEDSYYQAREKGVLLEKGRFHVSARGWKSPQFCPWEDGAGGRHDFVIKNTRTGETLQLSELIPHLVKEHHFFEGKATHYRLDPKHAVKVLELKPGEDYAPQYKETHAWEEGGGAWRPTGELEIWPTMWDIIDSAERVVDVAPGVKIHVKGNDAVVVAENDHVLAKPLKIRGEKLPLDKISRGTFLLHRQTYTYVEPD
jgi:hypothetical protein